MSAHTKLALCGILFAAALSIASCGGSPRETSDGETSGGMSAEQETTGQMRNMETTGSMDMGSSDAASNTMMENGGYSDERFIDTMVPHHEGAIEMARVALKNASHEQIKNLSRNIISTQRAEIRELRSIKEEEFGTSKVSMNMEQGQMKMMGMTDPDSLARKRPFDKAFIEAMIPHHESAVEMAGVAARESGNDRVQKLAEDIVAAQREEIRQMEDWRQSWYAKR